MKLILYFNFFCWPLTRENTNHFSKEKRKKKDKIKLSKACREVSSRKTHNPFKMLHTFFSIGIFFQNIWANNVELFWGYFF